MVDEIADDRGAHQGFLNHVLPNAVILGMEFLAIRFEQASANLLVFLVWRNKRMAELMHQNLVNLDVAGIPWCVIFLF